MFATRELTSEEYALLPCYAKAFRCSDDDKFSSKLISCTPAYLKFPHDDVNLHVLPITVWNKSNECLELDVENPKTNVFEVFYDQVSIYGGCQTVIYVQCTPHDRQVCFDTLRIKVTRKNKETDCIAVPLQLFPSFSWFSLPKLIVLPHVMIGNTAEITVALPKVKSTTQEKFFITVKSAYTDAINISPSHGTLSPQCSESTTEIVIRYSPKEFITLVHVVQIHFPGVDTAPHDLILFARAVPGLERDRFYKETQEILRWKPKPPKLKIPEPKLIFRSKSIATDVYNILEDESFQKEEDLTTPAGVIHFLLRREEKIPDFKKRIGPLGLTFAQERKLYEQKLKEFKDSMNKEEIRQKHITSQNFKPFLGQDTIEFQPELMEKIQHEEDLHMRQYEEAIGLRDNDPADLTRKKLQLSTQRNLRKINGGDFSIADMPKYSDKEIQQTNEEYRNCIREISRAKFKQSVYTLITRYRASKRIHKLQILKKEMLQASRTATFIPEYDEKNKGSRSIRKMSLSGEVKDDHRHSLQDDELQRLQSEEIHQQRLAAAAEAQEILAKLERRVTPEEVHEKMAASSMMIHVESSRMIHMESSRMIPVDRSGVHGQHPEHIPLESDEETEETEANESDTKNPSTGSPEVS